MKTLYLQALEVLTPGLHGWAQARAIFRHEQALLPADDQAPKYQANLLPPNEKRRATSLTRMVFHLGDLLLRQSPQLDPSRWQSVFASSGGDYPIIDNICRELAQDGDLSPTQFHNSVHNAVAGYWSIATGSKAQSTSISAYDSTFAAGLLEAATIAALGQDPVLLCVYDGVAVGPLRHARPIAQHFACALLLSHQPQDNTWGSFTLSLTDNASISRCDHPLLEQTRLLNSAARALPLLQAIAQGQPASLAFELFEGQLTVAFTPYG